MKRYSVSLSLFGVFALALAVPLAAHAQVSFSPMVGGYVPGGSINQITTGAQSVAKSREGTLSLGANLDFGALRIGAAYASGTTIKNANEQDIGKGNVLGAAADLVIRPIPRILVQPYLLAGAGEKFYKYDQSANLSSANNKQEFALHGGIGADVMLGSIGVAAELTDFVSKDADAKWNVHDAFLMVGLKLRLGN
jgi:hypothetical protein